MLRKTPEEGKTFIDLHNFIVKFSRLLHPPYFSFPANLVYCVKFSKMNVFKTEWIEKHEIRLKQISMKQEVSLLFSLWLWEVWIEGAGLRGMLLKGI